MKKLLFILIIIIILCYFQYNYINKLNEEFTILQYDNPNKDIFENIMNQKSIAIFTNIPINIKNIKNSLNYYNIPLCVKHNIVIKNEAQDKLNNLVIQNNYRSLFLQVKGTKKFFIFKPCDKQNLYFDKKNKTQVDFFNQNLNIYPNIDKSKYIEIIIRENQMIHIPYKFIYCSQALDDNSYIVSNSESIFSYFLKN